MFFKDENIKIATEPILVFTPVKIGWKNGKSHNSFLYVRPQKFLSKGKTYTNKKFGDCRILPKPKENNVRDYNVIRHEGFVSSKTIKDVSNYGHQTAPVGWVIAVCEIPIGAHYAEGWYYANPLYADVILSDKIKVICDNYAYWNH